VAYKAHNLENLKPSEHKFTKEDCVKGGKASGEARRKKATMLSVLASTLDEENAKGVTYRELVTLGLIKGAINGSSKNYQVIQELIAQKEQQDEAQQMIIKIPACDLGLAYVNVNRYIDDRKYYEYWFEGGRGSIKSSYWSEKVAELLENNPNMCALLIRKVGNTLKDSVFSQMQWGIDKLGETYPNVPMHWKATKSPLEMVNTNTNQIIYFRGADDPVKIKSIKPPKGKYIGIVVYEEFDQMNGMNEVGTIDRSVIRGGEDFIVFRVYNTPTSTQHFVNIEKRIPKADRYVHRSTYLDVPIEWLGKKFFDEAEYMKSINERQYRNVYLGEETGSGGNVFENVELREITDDEINTFDYIYMGLDFGWFPDPLAWTKMCYNPSQKTLYIFDEFVVNKMSNADVWEYLKNNKGVTENDLITADSAENKSIGDFKSYGSFMKGAVKGPGSVDYSMKWLASLAKIVIDPKRCPTSAQEFSTYEFQQDKDGNFISGYVDENNHCIDSCRYALNDIWKKKGN
jgi:PBSX family phage terminase large subunit